MRTDNPRVTTERTGHVLLITMDRPAKKNAVDADMTQALDNALDMLDDDPDLRCGILTGGPEIFCAGTDLATGPGDPTERGGKYGIAGRSRTTPLIAAVEGFALGGGMEIALACDLVVAGRSARFGLPEVTHGLVANCGALFRTHRALPLHVAKQLLLTGQPISAERAFTLGLANDVVDDGTAVANALRLAAVIAENAPVAVRETLAAVEAVVGRDDPHGWEVTAIAEKSVLASRDFDEGIAAFLERRTPVWKGN